MDVLQAHSVHETMLQLEQESTNGEDYSVRHLYSLHKHFSNQNTGAVGARRNERILLRLPDNVASNGHLPAYAIQKHERYLLWHKTNLYHFVLCSHLEDYSVYGLLLYHDNHLLVPVNAEHC